MGGNSASAYPPPTTNGPNIGYFIITGEASYYKGGTNITKTQLNLQFFVTQQNNQFLLDHTKTNTLSWFQLSTTATKIVGQENSSPSTYDGWRTKDVPIKDMKFSLTGEITSINFDTNDFEFLNQYQQSSPPGPFPGGFLYVDGNPLFQGEYAQNQFNGTINIPVPTDPSKLDVISLNYREDKGKGKPTKATYKIKSITNFIAGTAPGGTTPNPSGNTFGTPFIAVPEPSSTLSLLALTTLGVASTLKRKLKQSKSTGKETTKVG